MPEATDTRDKGQSARDLAETLLGQAADYETFAGTVGGELAPHYRDLACALRCRAAVLLGPYGTPDARLPQATASLIPHSSRDAGRAWQVLLSMVTARRERLTNDGAELLDGCDPGAVLWVAVFALHGLLSTVSERHVRLLMEQRGLSAAQMAEGVGGHGW